MSPGFEQLTGYTSGEVIGRNCRFLQGKSTDPAAVARIREAVRGAEPCTVELLNCRKDGTTFWNALSSAPVLDADGRAAHAVGVQTDVTARRSLEDQLRQSQKMDAIGQQAGGVAHDFNNQLTITIGYGEVLRQAAPLDAPSQRPLGEILKAAERSAGLTRQLLAFSRQLILTPCVLDLNEVVKGTGNMLRRLIGEDVMLVAVPSPDLWAVKAAPGQVEQALLNLRVNARDAMPWGGRLVIETRNVRLDAEYTRAHVDARPGPHALLVVSDTGEGMAPDVMARIFEPFFTTKEIGKGTGLGLATVFGIVKQSGGHLTVRSEVGTGTSFEVFFPRSEGADEGLTTARGPAAAPGSETVLLVEDEVGVRGLTRHVLAGHGYAILEAPGPQEGMRGADAHPGPIHLLVTDVVMPGGSGRSVADHLAARRPDLRVLFVSGYTSDAVVRHGIESDAVNFLQKPFSPSDLTQKVREVLGEPHSAGATRR